MLDAIQILKKNKLFNSLPKNDLESLGPLCSIQRLDHNKTLPWSEDEQPLVVVGFGLLKTIIDSNGSSYEPVLRFHAPGDLANDVQLLDAHHRTLRLVAASTYATVVCVQRERCLAIIEKNPQAAMIFARSVARAASDAYGRISAARYSVEARTAGALLKLAEDYGDERDDGRLLITLRMKRHELAGYVGATMESVIRTLSAWRRDHTIADEENGTIEILDPKKLETLSAELRAYSN